jgi:hypothetical protein
MSWSVSLKGKTPAIAAKLKEELAIYVCPEPEEAIRQAAMRQIMSILEAAPEGTPFAVDASGSQYISDPKDGKPIINMNIRCEPIYGWIE